LLPKLGGTIVAKMGENPLKEKNKLKGGELLVPAPLPSTWVQK